MIVTGGFTPDCHPHLFEIDYSISCGGIESMQSKSRIYGDWIIIVLGKMKHAKS